MVRAGLKAREPVLSIKVLTKTEIEVCMCVCACVCMCKMVVVFPHDTVLIGEGEHTGSKVCWEFKP